MSSEPIPRFFRVSIATLLTFAAIAAVIPGLSGCLVAVDTHFRRQSERQFEQEQEAILDRVRRFESAGNYQACSVEAAQVLPQARAYRWAQVHRQNCQDRLAVPQLQQAKHQAEKGEFAQAVQDAHQIPVGSSHYGEARQLIAQWSGRILEIAETHYWQPQDQLDQAVTIAEAIPAYSPIYKKAQAKIQQWQQTWNENYQHWLAAQQAIGQGQFDIASSQVQQIADHPFWTPHKSLIVQTVQQRRLQQQYEDTWQAAQRFLEAGEPENAIVTVAQLPDEFPWSERKQQLTVKAEVKQQQIALCQTLWLGFRSCY